MTTPGAVILCGGRGRRMGRPKEWLPFGPEAMLARLVRLVGLVAGPVVVVAAEGRALPALPGSVAIVRDPVADRGPLQGLAAGLAALPDRAEFAYASAVDAPFLEPAWIAHLVASIGDRDVAIAEVDGHLHPLAALYRRAAVLPAAEALLAGGERRLVALLDVVGPRILAADDLAGVDPGLGTLRNLNTPEEYRQALRDAGFAP